MARKDRFGGKRNQSPGRGGARATVQTVSASPLVRKPPTVYGKAFIVLEDAQRNTFEFVGGAWIPFARTIAECRAECQVRELPQQVNGKSRYEIRCPIE